MLQRAKWLEVSYSFWKARLLQIAVRHGIFGILERWRGRAARQTEARSHKAALDAPALAQRLKWEPRAAELFLNALVGCGLLKKKSSRYRNTALAKAFLIPNKKYYLGDLIELGDRGWGDWARLEESLASGRPLKKSDFFSADPSEVRSFILAMQNTAVGHADRLARVISLKGRRNLMDVGAGSAAFSLAFLKANPKLKATLFDLPLTLEVSREFVEQAGLTRRVEYQSGDFLKDPIRGRYDTCFVSHILHGMDETNCRRLLAKIFAALEEGGMLILQDFFLDPELSRPEFAALFSLNMLLHTDGGRSYSAKEVTAWLKETGFRQVRSPKLFLPREISILIAVK